MKKIVRKTCLLSLVCVLLFAFMFSATGCSSSPNAEVYNEGYEKLYNYVKENNKSDTDGVIQYSKDTNDAYFIFTGSTNKGADILISVCDFEWGDINFHITKEGVSDNNFLTVEISTEKVGSYYYKGKTLIKSTDQTSFTIIDEKECRTKNGTFTNANSSIVPTLDELLESIVEGHMLSLYRFIENTIGIPMELFAGK